MDESFVPVIQVAKEKRRLSEAAVFKVGRELGGAECEETRAR